MAAHMSVRGSAARTVTMVSGFQLWVVQLAPKNSETPISLYSGIYTSNLIRVSIIISGIFLNQGIMESLGTPFAVFRVEQIIR